MKKNFYIIFIVLLFLSCTDLGAPKEIKTKREGQAMPSFNILLSDGISYYTTKDIQGKPIVIFYFSPSCPYCRMETRRIINNMNELKNIKFIFIASNNFPLMKNFYKEFEIEKYKNIILGFDIKKEVVRYYKSTAVPFLSFYGIDNTLNKSFIGVMSANQIKSNSKI
jgi:thiol-disulfide isomerase/thioredoxin